MSSITMPADSTQSELKRRLKHKTNTRPMRSLHKHDGDSHASKPKRPKNSGKIVKKYRKGHSSDKTDDSCSDRESDLDLSKELLPISGYVNSSEQMVEHMFRSISMKKLRSMLPEILKPINISELKSLCMQQLEGMTKKRVCRILDGDDPETISSSGSEDECIDSIPTQGVGESVKCETLTETVATVDTSEKTAAADNESRSTEILSLQQTTSLLNFEKTEEHEDTVECRETVVNKDVTTAGSESSLDGKPIIKAAQRSSTWDLNDDDQELDYMEDVEEEPEKACDGSETPSSLPSLDSEPEDTCSPLIFPTLDRKLKRSAEREIPATTTSESTTSTVTTAAGNQEDVQSTVVAQEQTAEEQHAFACAENENNINVENEINVPGDNTQQRIADITLEDAIENDDPRGTEAVKILPDTSSAVVDPAASTVEKPSIDDYEDEGLCSPERDVGIVLEPVKSASTTDGAEMLIDLPEHEFSDEDSNAAKLKRRSTRSNSPHSTGRTSSQISSVVERPRTSHARSRDNGRRERDSDGHRRYGRGAESNREHYVSAGKRRGIEDYPSDIRSNMSRQDTQPLSRHKSSETSRRRSLSPKFRSHLMVRRSRSRSRSPFRSNRLSERHSGRPDLHSPIRRDIVVHSPVSPRHNSLSVTISNDPLMRSEDAENADGVSCQKVRSPKAGSHDGRKSPNSSRKRMSGSSQVTSSKMEAGRREKTSLSPTKDKSGDDRNSAPDVLDSANRDVGKTAVVEPSKLSQPFKDREDADVGSKTVEKNIMDSKLDRNTSAINECGQKSSLNDSVKFPDTQYSGSSHKLLSKSGRENLPHDLSQSKTARVDTQLKSSKCEHKSAIEADHHSEVKKLPLVKDIDRATVEAGELRKRQSQEDGELTRNSANISRTSRSLSEPKTLLPTLSAKTLASASTKPFAAEMSTTDTKAVEEITSSCEANEEIVTNHDDEKSDLEESQSSDPDLEQSESSDAATLSKTQLEILELEMRARAIKAMLRAQEELEESEQQRLEMRRKSNEPTGSSCQQDGGTPTSKLKPLSLVTVQPREVVLQKSSSKSRGLVQRAEVVARKKRLEDAREQLSAAQQTDRSRSIQLKSSVSPAPTQRLVVRNSSKDENPTRVIRISPIRMEPQDTQPRRSVASAVVSRRSFGSVAVNADSDRDDSPCQVVLSPGMQRVVQITHTSSNQDHFVGRRSSGRNRFRRSRRGYRH